MHQFKRKIYYQLSPKMRLLVRKAFFLPIDLWNTLKGKRHKYEPMKGDIYIGSGDFIQQGLHHLDLLKTHIDLQPNDRVLDIGSGMGRTAVALTSYLTQEGRYEGFDVVEKGVKWCNNKLKRDFSNFNFKYVPLNNNLYNNNKEEAENFKFPYEDNSFDKVFLFSVFTHMTVEEIENYLFEIKRVLKPGGLCLSTFFLYDSNIEQWVAQNQDFSFPVDKGNFRLMNDQVQSANIALNTDLLQELIAETDLRKEKMVEGFWKKGIDSTPDNDYQDIVVLST